MSGFLVAAVIASTALSLYGQKKEADAEKRALQDKSRLSGLQADELLARTQINIKQMEKEGKKVTGKFDYLVARSGVEASSSRQELLTQIGDKIRFERRVAEFDAQMIRMGGQAALAQSADIDKAAKIRMISTIFSGAGKAYSGSKD